MLKKYKAYLFILPIFMLASIVIFNVCKADNTNDIVVQNDIYDVEKNEQTEPTEEEIKTVKVDVKGEVSKPGVYALEEGKRINDAINLSGGLTENADTSLLNLSKVLKDEMVIIVYNKDKIEQIKKEVATPKTIIEYIEKECVCPDTINDACMVETNSNDDKKDIIDTTNGKVNINTATKDILLTIKGIGETKADAIIKYRSEVGLFKDINEIKNISGIGESTFEKIKDNITV